MATAIISTGLSSRKQIASIVRQVPIMPKMPPLAPTVDPYEKIKTEIPERTDVIKKTATVRHAPICLSINMLTM